MKKIITMLFTMTIVISLTAQNNGFNFNKTNDYKKDEKTYSPIKVIPNELVYYGETSGEIISFSMFGFYKGEKVYVTTEGNLVNKKMRNVYLNCDNVTLEVIIRLTESNEIITEVLEL